MVLFVGKGPLNDQNSMFGQIIVTHLPEKLDFSKFSFQYTLGCVQIKKENEDFIPKLE